MYYKIRPYLDFLLGQGECAHPHEQVALFSAGSYGCCYRQAVDVQLLKRLWQHTAFQHPCPHCGHTAYIFQWDAHATRGDYWYVGAYCPHCDCELVLHSTSEHPLVSWRTLRDVTEECAKED